MFSLTQNLFLWRKTNYFPESYMQTISRDDFSRFKRWTNCKRLLVHIKHHSKIFSLFFLSFTEKAKEPRARENIFRVYLHQNRLTLKIELTMIEKANVEIKYFERF